MVLKPQDFPEANIALFGDKDVLPLCAYTEGGVANEGTTNNIQR